MHIAAHAETEICCHVTVRPVVDFANGYGRDLAPVFVSYLKCLLSWFTKDSLFC